MFDLSALDAELEGLGRAPENTTSLAREYAGITLSGSLSAQLEQVDAELSALSNGDSVPLARAPARFDHALAPIAHEPSGVVRVEPALRAERANFVAEPEPVQEPEPIDQEPEPIDQEPEPFEMERQASEPPEIDVAASGSFDHVVTPRAASVTESQEIVLPDPIAREELSSESGELSISGSDPESGSFELPDSPTEPRIMPEDVPQPGAAAKSEQLLPFDDVQDALEGSQPIAVHAGRATVSPRADLDLERDPDAEFDALLSEATDPRGIPTPGGSNEVDTDDLLRGLEGDLEDDDLNFEQLDDDDAPHEADMLTRSLYQDSGDSTELLDRATLGAIENTATKSAQTELEPETEEDDTFSSLLTSDELDSGELEIIDDEPTLAPQSTPLAEAFGAALEPGKATKVPPPARPGLSNKAPPPPPPSSSPEKRPSFLGRLFTKREGE